MERRLQVAIVEDDELNAIGLSLCLEHMACDIVGIANDALCGLTIPQMGKIDIAFVDVHLQGTLSGLFVGKTFMEQGIGVVFVSGSDYLIPENYKTLSVATLRKPFSPKQLEETVQSARNFCLKQIEPRGLCIDYGTNVM